MRYILQQHSTVSEECFRSFFLYFRNELACITVRIVGKYPLLIEIAKLSTGVTTRGSAIDFLGVGELNLQTGN